MATEQIGDYEIEYSGQRVIGGEGWVAMIAIFGHSTNPMHRNAVLAAQRVSPERVFDTEDCAQAHAHEVAVEWLQGRAS